MLGLDLVGSFHPVLLIIAGVLELVLAVALPVLVARYRDDDILEAGVLFAIITGVHILILHLIQQVRDTGTVWAAVAGIPIVFIQLTVRAAIVGTISAGLVWLIRVLWPRPRPLA